MRFSLFRIPIRIKPGFVLLAIGIGVLNTRSPVLDLIRVQVFVGVVVATFVGVLIHELGHALEARRAGATPEVTLNMLGGLTRFQASKSHWRNLWISSAGIVYQLTAAGLAYATYQWGPLPSEADLPSVIDQPDVVLVWIVLRVFVLINVFFALINLVPVGGLDGGAIIEHFLKAVRVKRAAVVMFVFYALIGIGVVLWAVAYQEWWILAVATYLTGTALWRQSQEMGRDEDVTAFPDAESRGRQLLATGEHEELLTWARAIRTSAQSPAYAIFGASWELLALKRLGQHEEMSDLVERVGHALPDVVVVDSLAVCGSHDEVVMRYVDNARSPTADLAMVIQVAKSLIDVGRPQEAAELIGLIHLQRLPVQALIQIHNKLWDAGAHGLAEGLRQAISGRKDVGYGAGVRMLQAQGETDQALQRLKREIEDAAGGTAMAWLSWVLAEDGRSSESAEALQKAISLGGIRDGLEIQYAFDVAGHIDQALQMGEWLLNHTSLSEEARSAAAYNHACGLITLGDTEGALMALAEVDPAFLISHGLEDDDLDPLRALPEFRALWSQAETAAASA